MPYQARHRGTPRTRTAAKKVTRTAALTGVAATVPMIGIAGPAHAATTHTWDRTAVPQGSTTLSIDNASVRHSQAPLSSPVRRLAAPTTYVVRPGDTLSTIASTQKVSGGWRGLWKLNRGVVGSNPNLIFPDQKLRLGGKAAPSEPARKNSAERSSRSAKRAAAPKANGWTLPLESYNLTGRFGANGSNWSSSHHGLDFAAPEGTPIHAVGAGEIIETNSGDAYGNSIKIRHADGTVTLYGHMTRYARTSGSVDTGTVIGYVGSTGNATGPHVHLEVRPNGGGLDDAVDPEAWLRNKGLNP